MGDATRTSGPRGALPSGLLLLLLLLLVPSTEGALIQQFRLARDISRARSPLACALEEFTPSEDHMVTAISADGSISAKAIVTTQLVGETSRLQGLGGLAAAALGRALSCSLLVAEGLKEDETFQVNFQGDGPLRGVMATANGKLEARGYVGNPAVTLPPNAKGKFDVGAGVGKGALQVVRTKNLPGEDVPTPYTSITEIKTGEIPEDINWCGAPHRPSVRARARPQRRLPRLTATPGRHATLPGTCLTPSSARAQVISPHISPISPRYLLDSEQREGALAAGVFVRGVDEGTDLNGAKLGGAKVEAAGGWYVQLLPFADESALEQLTANLNAISHRSPTSMVRDGLGARQMLELLLDGLGPQFLTARPLESLATFCPCSEERVMRTLRLLPRSEVDDIMEKHEDIEVKCEFCGKRYGLTPEEIRERL